MNIVFFGDSITFGYGLPDCLVDPPEWNINWENIKPSKFGWASIISKKFNVNHINMSYPGSSNMQIHWAVRNYKKFNLNDLIIVQWSYSDRDYILNDNFLQIGPWTNSDQSNSYYLTHDDIDMCRRSILTIEHTALWLSHHNLKWLFFCNNRLLIPSHIDSIIVEYFNDYRIDAGIDGIHPGIESHKKWASVVESYINDAIYNKKMNLPLNDSNF